MTTASFPQLTDSHAHLTSSSLYEHVSEVVERAAACGITKIINICTDFSSIEKGLQLAQTYPWISNAGAVHPHDAEKEGNGLFPIIEQYARFGSFVAIGETGLDYHYQHSTPEIQQYYLRKHLQLALECKLPVIIHCREAFNDFFSILDEEYLEGQKWAPGVLHCFTGTLSEAEEVIARGWYLSFSGIITFKKSVELREVAKIVPLERLLIETDAPYLAPQSHRGKPNEPSYLLETASVLASLRGISLKELARITTENAKALFKGL